MTDEERKRLCEILRAWGSTPTLTDPGSLSLLGRFVRESADEIERLQRELSSTLGLLYQESERRAEESQRIERLEKDVEALRRM